MGLESGSYRKLVRNLRLQHEKDCGVIAVPNLPDREDDTDEWDAPPAFVPPVIRGDRQGEKCECGHLLTAHWVDGGCCYEGCNCKRGVLA